MSLRSIAQIVSFRRDGGHDRIEWLKNVCLQLVAQDGNVETRSALVAAAKDNGETEEESEQEAEAVQAYLHALPEQQRAIFFQARAGVSPTKIARMTGLDRTTVMKSLSRIYADLRIILNDARPRHSFPTTKEAGIIGSTL